MEIIIQKFGGTSLRTPEERKKAVQIVTATRNTGYSVVVVVSAIGRSGDPYATDTLLEMFAEGSKTGGRGASPRETDLLLSCGEIISATLFAGLLQASGLSAQALTGAQAGIITDDNFGNAHIIRIVPDRVLQALEQGQVVVVAGFQGRTDSGEITTLGRGGSDTTAVALGAALKAKRVEIFTDVSGIMTADPRISREAKLLKRVTYQEVVELAHLGAKVIHPRAVELAMAAGLELWIKGFNDDSEGTLVAGSPERGVEIHGDKVITGIAHISGVAQVRVNLNPETPAPRQHVEIFSIMARHDISVDIINVFPDLVVFTVQEKDLETADTALREAGYSPESRGGFAKVSAVGAGMRGVPGVMARIAKALTEAGVEIFQSVDSHANISCLVREDQLEAAIRALHKEFALAGD
ncbi:MAG: aspartate kinase [Firmicutes bacterium]|nr:aspartate kinase [Bacillota bacterium]